MRGLDCQRGTGARSEPTPGQFTGRFPVSMGNRGPGNRRNALPCKVPMPPAIPTPPAAELVLHGVIYWLPESFQRATDTFPSSSPAINWPSPVITRAGDSFETPPPVVNSPIGGIKRPRGVLKPLPGDIPRAPGASHRLPAGIPSQPHVLLQRPGAFDLVIADSLSSPGAINSPALGLNHSRADVK